MLKKVFKKRKFCFLQKSASIQPRTSLSKLGVIRFIYSFASVQVPRPHPREGRREHLRPPLPAGELPRGRGPAPPRLPHLGAPLRYSSSSEPRRGSKIGKFRKFLQFLAGSFSAVSKRNFARKYAFDSIFQALQDLHTFAPLQYQNFRKKSDDFLLNFLD